MLSNAGASMVTAALAATGGGFVISMVGCLLMARSNGPAVRVVVAFGVALIFVGMLLAFAARF